jgi:hypothetical protein
MNWQDILIIALVLVIVYFLFFKKKAENFDVLENKVVGTNEYYKQLCERTTKDHDDVKKYLADNCTEEIMDVKKNFRGAINSRSWCRIKGEEEITSDINRDTWCGLVGVEQKPMVPGNDEPKSELLGNL